MTMSRLSCSPNRSQQDEVKERDIGFSHYRYDKEKLLEAKRKKKAEEEQRLKLEKE